MQKISVALSQPLLTAAVFCCFSQAGYAEEVLTAPNGSAPPQAQQTQQDLQNPQNPQSPPTPKPGETLKNGAAPLSAPDLKSAEQFGAPPVSWNDTFVGYRYSSEFHYPGVADKVTQNIGYLSTIGGFKFGSYAFNVDYLVSNSANPEAGGPSNGGAQEVYSIGRVELSAGKILGRYIGNRFIRDFGFTAGYEFGTKNDAYGERARMLVFGPTIEFAVPRGFWNVTAGVRTESNHNGITGVDVHFNPAWHVESSWLVPFQVGPLPLVFKGFASVTGPKGRDGFGVETTTEFLARGVLLADLGSFAGHPRVVYAGVGYEYWHHMYGSPTSETVGTITSAPMFVAEVHF